MRLPVRRSERISRRTAPQETRGCSMAPKDVNARACWWQQTFPLRGLACSMLLKERKPALSCAGVRACQAGALVASLRFGDDLAGLELSYLTSHL